MHLKVVCCLLPLVLSFAHSNPCNPARISHMTEEGHVYFEIPERKPSRLAVRFPGGPLLPVAECHTPVPGCSLKIEGNAFREAKTTPRELGGYTIDMRIAPAYIPRGIDYMSLVVDIMVAPSVYAQQSECTLIFYAVRGAPVCSLQSVSVTATETYIPLECLTSLSQPGFCNFTLQREGKSLAPLVESTSSQNTSLASLVESTSAQNTSLASLVSACKLLIPVGDFKLGYKSKVTYMLEMHLFQTHPRVTTRSEVEIIQLKEPNVKIWTNCSAYSGPSGSFWIQECGCELEEKGYPPARPVWTTGDYFPVDSQIQEDNLAVLNYVYRSQGPKPKFFCTATSVLGIQKPGLEFKPTFEGPSVVPKFCSPVQLNNGRPLRMNLTIPSKTGQAFTIKMSGAVSSELTCSQGKTCRPNVEGASGQILMEYPANDSLIVEVQIQKVQITTGKPYIIFRLQITSITTFLCLMTVSVRPEKLLKTSMTLPDSKGFMTVEIVSEGLVFPAAKCNFSIPQLPLQTHAFAVISSNKRYQDYGFSTACRMSIHQGAITQPGLYNVSVVMYPALFGVDASWSLSSAFSFDIVAPVVELKGKCPQDVNMRPRTPVDCECSLLRAGHPPAKKAVWLLDAADDRTNVLSSTLKTVYLSPDFSRRPVFVCTAIHGTGIKMQPLYYRPVIHGNQLQTCDGTCLLTTFREANDLVEQIQNDFSNDALKRSGEALLKGVYQDLEPADNKFALDIMNKIRQKLTSKLADGNGAEIDSGTVEVFAEVSSKLISMWSETNSDNSEQEKSTQDPAGVIILDMMENLAIAALKNPKMSSQAIIKQNIATVFGKVVASEAIKFPTSSDSSNWAEASGNTVLIAANSVPENTGYYVMLLRNMEAAFGTNSNGRKIMSSVLSVGLENPITTLSPPLQLDFILRKDERTVPKCVFLVMPHMDRTFGEWSTAGCKTQNTPTGVKCICNHVTSFAVLRAQENALTQKSCQDNGEDYATGKLQEKTCPEGYLGTISRMCNQDGTWGPTNNTCILKELMEADEQITQALNNTSDAPFEETVERVASNLDTGLMKKIEPLDLKKIVDIMYKVGQFVESNQTKEAPKIDRSILEKFADVSSGVMAINASVWEKGNEKKEVEKSQTGSLIGAKLLSSMEDIVKSYVQNSNTTDETVVTENIVMTFGKLERGNPIRFPGRPDGLTNDSWAVKSGNTAFLPEFDLSESALSADVQETRYSLTVYRGLESRFDSEVDETGPCGERLRVQSDVISMVLNISQPKLKQPFEMNFSVNQNQTFRPACAFLVTTKENFGQWSTDGCRTELDSSGAVQCFCDHLTNFAILMSPSGTNKCHHRYLSIITIIGCSISIICLVLTIFSYVVLWKHLGKDKDVLHVNLAACLLLVYIVFISFLKQTEDRSTCVAIAAILQFLLLCTFFMMLGEGVILLLSLRIESTGKTYWWKVLPCVYISAFVIVVISVSVTRTEGFINKNFCWLDFESGFIWAFLAPALLVILANIGIAFVALRKMQSSKAFQSKTDADKFKANLKLIFVLSPLLGLTWIFGILAINEDAVAFQYIFTILNTLQGVMIFVFYCLLVKKITDGFKLMWRKKKASLSLEFSSDTASRGKKRASPKTTSTMEQSTSFLTSSREKKTSFDTEHSQM